MNVLSLFDGISGGRVALDRAGIKVDKYFASEIDKHAITVAQRNFPDTIQLGDVTKIKTEDLPKIDLVFSGFPCQPHSTAGKQGGFNDPRGQLFFDALRILNELKEKNPDIKFLFENVRMKKESADLISQSLGVEGVLINSALVSAQNRVRTYWTNIQNVTQPEDKGILLADVIENGFVDREKSYCIDANYSKGGNLTQYFEKGRRQLVFGAALRNQVTKNGTLPFLNIRKDYKSNCVVSSFSAKLNGVVIDGDFRKLSVKECEILQNLEPDYTQGISETQRYKCIGNGWTVDVIAHILKGLHES